MSKDVADLFRLEYDELRTFVSNDDDGGGDVKPSSMAYPPLWNLADNVIVAACLSLIILLSVFIGCAFWRRKRSKKDGYRDMKKAESIDLQCEKSSLNHIVRSKPSFPQLLTKPIFSIQSAARRSLGDEEMRKLCEEKIDVAAKFDTNQKRLQIDVIRVNLNSFKESFRENSFTYLIVSLETTDSSDTSYVESELLPVVGTSYSEETFEFQLTRQNVPSTSVKVSRYANDRYSKHRLVSEYTYGMKWKDEAITDIPILPVTLTEISRSDDNKGEILFSLCYMPTSGRLTFVAMNGRNICNEVGMPISTFVGVSLMVYGKTMKTQETTGVKTSVNPVYNEALVFHIPLENIKDTDIVVSVFSAENIESRQPKMLGKVIVGLVGPVSGTNLGRKHWEAMLSTPRKPVAQWHCISRFL